MPHRNHQQRLRLWALPFRWKETPRPSAGSGPSGPSNTRMKRLRPTALLGALLAVPTSNPTPAPTPTLWIQVTVNYTYPSSPMAMCDKVKLDGTMPASTGIPFAFNFYDAADTAGNVIFLFSPRTSCSCVVRNSRENGAWGSEERSHTGSFSFTAGQAYVIVFERSSNGWLATVNDVRRSDLDFTEARALPLIAYESCGSGICGSWAATATSFFGVSDSAWVLGNPPPPPPPPAPPAPARTLSFPRQRKRLVRVLQWHRRPLRRPLLLLRPLRRHPRRRPARQSRARPLRGIPA
jgi:hypothetical protein